MSLADERLQDNFLKEHAQTRRYSLGNPTSIKVTPDGKAVLFLRSGPKSKEHDLYEYNIATGKERKILTAEQLLGGVEEELTAEEKARRERMRMTARGIVGYSLSKDGTQILVPLSGSLYLVDRATGEHRELASEAGYPIDARLSPDGKRLAVVREGDLFVMDIATGEETKLTSGSSETLTFGAAEFVAQEEMDRMHGYWWSPDSAYLAYQETDTSEVEEWFITDPANPDKKPDAWRYPRPGKANAEVRLGIIPAAGGETTWIDWDRDEFSYLANVTWSDGAPLTLVVQNREQTIEQLLKVDTSDGSTHTLLEETDAAWINLDGHMPKWLPDGAGFLWSSENNGVWQLLRYDREGNLVVELTTPELNYRGLVGIDETSNTALILAGPDPTERHLYRIALTADGAEPKKLTKAPGMHGATLGSDSGVYVTYGQTLAEQLPHRVVSAEGEQLGALESVALTPPFKPSVELVKLDTDPPMCAAIVRPRGDWLTKHEKLPVLVSVYGGPHAQVVTTDGDRYLVQQWFADQGFIVVSLDGRGTPARGRDWERAIKHDLIKVPLADQVAGLKALGEQYDELDISRVGIFGWSFGGYFSAMAVMQQPDVFHVGIAGAPVVDWRDYDTHYTERYMGLPEKNLAGYDAASVLTYAPQLDRPLLLIHGTADDNVYFLHSTKLVDRLLHEGRQVDFLPLPGSTHMVADPDLSALLNLRMADYFREHLHNENDSD
ncbi:DPP IV N-terminal domain-containing protein [Aeoliella sp.]|uniref:DPP IV N-terminal domain-containing protein n=1 Tax=Aeoliella sp. TaxID=2795800 RepID=UPI003CCBD8EE